MLYLSKVLILVTGDISSNSISKTYEQKDFEYQRNDDASASYSDYDANSGYDEYIGDIKGIILLIVIRCTNF